MDAGFAASDLLGYSAAGLVLLTFLAQSMPTCSAIAIASNAMFIAYALVAWLPPVRGAACVAAAVECVAAVAGLAIPAPRARANRADSRAARTVDGIVSREPGTV
mgnify:CR=1 FL=1